MRLGDLIVGTGLASRRDMDRALEQQRHSGRDLGEVLIEAGILSQAQLDGLKAKLPPARDTIADLGIEPRIVFDLLVKFVSVTGAATTGRIADALGLSHRLATAVVTQARADGLVDAKPGLLGGDLRVELTPRGKALAAEAFANNTYVGPVPVPLAEYAALARRQTIRPEKVGARDVERAFADMVLSGRMLERIGTAANAGRAMLLYGASGNGKTLIAEHIGRLFPTMVLIPHCFEVGGQIVKVFDAAVHHRLDAPEGRSPAAASILADEFDPRWVPCLRPFVVAGGELSLDMLDLKFDPLSRFYEAPLHVKATNGVLLIDDFGRQLASPVALLNRWVVPMDRGMDYLKLHTGQSFTVPFDVLQVFATNLTPSDLMDPAFLRRLPYKIHVVAPTPQELAEIFRRAAAHKGVALSEEMIAYAIRSLSERGGILACHQPATILDLILDACAFAGRAPVADRAMIDMALENLLLEQAPR